MKLCECGCGLMTSIARQDCPKGTYSRGMPKRFIRGHQPKKHGEEHSCWKGGRTITDGYVYLYRPDHPNADVRGCVLESRLIAEKALGKSLPSKVIVHHWDGKKGIERPQDIVICEDLSYHALLHRRTRAYRECGHAHWLRCNLCHKYGDPKEIYVNPHGYGTHRSCHAEYERKRRSDNVGT